MPPAKPRFEDYVTNSRRPRRAGVAPRAALLVRQEITQDSLRLDDLSSEIAEYAAATLTINGQNVHVVSCYIGAAMLQDTMDGLNFRNISRGQHTHFHAGVQRSVINPNLTARALRLTATPQPDS
ncbi:unnamed protein product [Ixodes persulcatus]